MRSPPENSRIEVICKRACGTLSEAHPGTAWMRGERRQLVRIVEYWKGGLPGWYRPEAALGRLHRSSSFPRSEPLRLDPI